MIRDILISALGLCLVATGALAVSALMRIKTYSKKIARHLEGGRTFYGHPMNAAAKTFDFERNQFAKTHLSELKSASGSEMRLSLAFRQAMDAIDLPLGLRRETPVVCTVAIGEDYRRIVQPCLTSQAEFAKRHGFRYVVLEKPPLFSERPAPWLKISLIGKLIRAGAERVIYIDADAMVTNDNIEIEPFYGPLESSNSCMMLTEDEAGINSGVIFAINRPETLRMLDLIWLYDEDIHNGTWEQNAIKILMNTYMAFDARIMTEPDPKKFNSFPVERRKFHPTRTSQIWSEGDFICHFSGLRNEQLKNSIYAYQKALSAR